MTLTKVCGDCGKDKLVELFPVVKGKLYTYCNECRKSQNNESLRKHPKSDEAHIKNALLTKKRQTAKQQYVADSKLGKPCVDCGIVYPPYVMDYDHIIGEKRFGLGYARFHSYESIDKEIAKCVLRCANCHRIKTHGQKFDHRDTELEKS